MENAVAGPGLEIRWLSADGLGIVIFWRAMPACLGGGCVPQPALQARRVPTSRKRGLHGREAAKKRTGQGCRWDVRRERLPGGLVGSDGVAVVLFFSRAGRAVWAALL